MYTPEQYGFRKAKSTGHVLLDNVEKTKVTIENKLLTMGIFIDLTKAYDVLDHDILLNKLEHYGIRGTALSSCLTI